MAKRNKYSDEMKSFVKDLVDNQGFSVTKATQLMCEQFKVKYTETVGRKFRQFMNPDGGILKIEESPIFKKARSKKHDSEKKRFIISSAQSGTSVHKKFLKNMEVYAKFIDAEILIVATRYKNPTSLSASKSIKDNEFWDKSVQPYLTANYNELHKHLHLAGNLKVSPTASTPLTGLNGISGKASMIIGSPRVHLRSLPVLDSDPKKTLMTTGSCTFPEYTDTKAGYKGYHHHTFGLVVVECDGDDFHTRQVTATDNGSFYDLIYFVQEGNVNIDSNPKEAIILGDIHTGSTDMDVFSVSKQMLKLFSPKYTFVHDLFDGSSINRHERNNPVALLEKEKDGKLDLIKEIEEMLIFIEDHLLEYNPIISRSNHDIFLDTFISDADWRKEGNKFAYLLLAHRVATGAAPNGLIPSLIKERFGDKVRCLSINDSFKVKGWECGQHGHKNSNGSRPSPTSFKNMNTKICSAHSHTIFREDGYASVGTNTYLRLGYNESWSSWGHGNAVIHPDGKLQQLRITNNKYTTLY